VRRSWEAISAELGLVGAGHLSLGDIEWVEPDGWAVDLDHSIWLTVTEPSCLSP
jgi:hypothetical protein